MMDALKEATGRMMDEMGARLAGGHAVPTAFDRGMFSLMQTLAKLDPERSWEDAARDLPGPGGASVRAALESLKSLHRRREQGRFVRFGDRLQHFRSDLPGETLALMNGVAETLHWRGVPLFKSPLDMALLQMLLWELEPRTVLEIGSGLGGSALWLGDVITAFGQSGHVLSVDVNPPEARHARVSFIRGDLMQVEQALPDVMLSRLQHPLLILEDAHVNLPAVLETLHCHTRAGDYLVVEDSLDKLPVLGEWLGAKHDAYLVDTRFVDFFGQNATFCQDAILVRV